MPHDRYQTVQELADRLEVAEATVRQWIKSGALRAIDIGKGWRISDTDLERFLSARETVPRAGAGKEAESAPSGRAKAVVGAWSGGPILTGHGVGPYEKSGRADGGVFVRVWAWHARHGEAGRSHEGRGARAGGPVSRHAP